MTIKDAILKALEELKVPSTYVDVYNSIISGGFYEFSKGKTPESTVSALLGDFIRSGDSRVRRISEGKSKFRYYLTKLEFDIETEINEKTQIIIPEKKSSLHPTFSERSLHKLLVSFLSSENIISKTIYHEQSKKNNDDTQKWINPDIVGISFLQLKSQPTSKLMKQLNNRETVKLFSYELKREIHSDAELKKAYFQAVSNSSWANYGYLVAFDISDNLFNEIERLNHSFGIGVIELKSNPYESRIIRPARYNELDYKMIDKLCNVNPDFLWFIEQTEKILSAPEQYHTSVLNELRNSCDEAFQTNEEVESYCKENHIPFEKEQE